MKFIVIHNGQSYEFMTGTECSIFDSAVSNGIIDSELLSFVSFVWDVYLKADGHTSPGALSDFIAENYEEYKSLSRSDILEKFYEEEI